jgi:hypothetical protein
MIAFGSVLFLRPKCLSKIHKTIILTPPLDTRFSRVQSRSNKMSAHVTIIPTLPTIPFASCRPHYFYHAAQRTFPSLALSGTIATSTSHVYAKKSHVLISKITSRCGSFHIGWLGMRSKVSFDQPCMLISTKTALITSNMPPAALTLSPIQDGFRTEVTLHRSRQGRCRYDTEGTFRLCRVACAFF